MKKLLFIILSMVIMACNSNVKQKHSEMPKKRVDEIRFALTELLERKKSDAFVIFTDENSGKFVQFAGSSNEDLYFSLPLDQLNQHEISTAKEKLKKYNIHLSSSPMYIDETMQHSEGTMNEFGERIGRDVENAVNITITVLTEIFELDEEIKLVIVEN